MQADFNHAGSRYKLWVTDPIYEQAYLAKANGQYLVRDAYLTVSIGEPYTDGCCYKLVAAIIERALKKQGQDWRTYEDSFLELLRSRAVEDAVSPDLIEDSCLLCSEGSPSKCHRRLVAEYLRDCWDGVEIVHLR